MTIENILDAPQRTALRQMVENKVPYSKIRELYPRLSKNEIAIFYDYYLKLKNNGTVSFGAKEAPYYTGESIDDLYPKYTWQELSIHEKEFYLARIGKHERL